MRNFTTIGVAGDWHGNLMWALMAVERFAVNGITEIIHVGDFGVWPGTEGDRYIAELQTLTESLGITLYITPGNHEDYVQVNACEVAEDGWKHLAPNILLAPRGHRWEWNGRSFVSLGGANSIDFEGRTEGLNWWTEERITLGDAYRTVAGGHADIMITHEAPTGYSPKRHGLSDSSGWGNIALTYAKESSDMVRQVVDGVKPDLLLHGHYHWFHDTLVKFNDGVENYNMRIIGLDKDNHPNNIGVLNLNTMEFNVLRMNGS